MPCRQARTYFGETGIGKPTEQNPNAGFPTEAECLQQCAEGACCENGGCVIKAACACCGEFKGAGTTCQGGPCNPLP